MSAIIDFKYVNLKFCVLNQLKSFSVNSVYSFGVFSCIDVDAFLSKFVAIEAKIRMQVYHVYHLNFTFTQVL